jgi:predicted amidohydrolase YtcJ
MPSSKDLPQDLYILLHRTDLHCFWVSPPVLDLLPSPLPPVPAGGSMPSPGVFCDNAMDLVLPFVPPTTKEEKRSFILAAQNKLHEYGIVGIHDAGVVQEDRELYEEMAESEELELRVYAMVECYKRNTFCPAQAKKVARKDGMLTVNAVKLFAGFTPCPPIVSAATNSFQMELWALGARPSSILIRINPRPMERCFFLQSSFQH